jgi:hypothetical protein
MPPPVPASKVTAGAVSEHLAVASPVGVIKADQELAKQNSLVILKVTRSLQALRNELPNFLHWSPTDPHY